MTSVLTACGNWWDLFQWALRNKDGLTQDEAKKLFFALHSKKSSSEPELPPPSPLNDRKREELPRLSGSGEQASQINRLLTYMEETNRRLDRIEANVAHIRQQVDRLVKNL